MATPKEQAAQAAQAAVPTKGSINRQYGQSISDVEGFTTALARLLGGMPSAQGAYNTAISQQQGIDSAAQAALRATGTPYAAGSGAAVAGLGTSALSNLNARGAAAGAYAATLPHVAAARGTLGVQSLETARQNALQTRNEDYRQAYLSALAQARQNAVQQRQFEQSFGLQKANLTGYLNGKPTLAEQQILSENRRYFANLRTERLIASLKYGSGGSTLTQGSVLNGTGLTKATGLTAGEVNVQVAKADSILQPALKTKATAIYGYQNPQTGKITQVEPAGSKFPRVVIGYRNIPTGGGGDPVSSGVPFAVALRELGNQGIPAPIAFYAAARLYSQARTRGDARGNSAYNTFVHWMAGNGFPQYRRLWQRLNQSSGTPPSFNGQPH